MNSHIEKQIGQNIRKLRESCGMTQEEVSVQLQVSGCDITRSALAKIEVGQRHIYPDEIMHIRKVLDTTYDKMFEIDE